MTPQQIKARQLYRHLDHPSIFYIGTSEVNAPFTKFMVVLNGERCGDTVLVNPSCSLNRSFWNRFSPILGHHITIEKDAEEPIEDKTALQLVEELANARNKEAKEAEEKHQKELAEKAEAFRLLWQPCTDLIASIAAKHPDKILYYSNTPLEFWKRTNYPLPPKWKLERLTTGFAFSSKYEQIALEQSPAELVPHLINILADLIR